MQVIKGVPVERYTRQESVIAYWLIGSYFGRAVSNNKKVRHGRGHLQMDTAVPERQAL